MMSTPTLKGRWSLARARLGRATETTRKALQKDFDVLDAELRARLGTNYTQFAQRGAGAPTVGAPIKMWSEVVQDHIYIVRNAADAAAVPEGSVIYTAAEIAHLKGSAANHIRCVHETKKQFPGSTIL